MDPQYLVDTSVDRAAGSIAPAFSLSTALRLAFNIIDPIAYPGAVAQGEEAHPQLSYAGIRSVTKEEAEKSHLGTNILMPITFKAGQYNRYDSQGRVQKVSVGGWRLPLSVVVEMSREKAMGRTPIVASRSSVKEIYGHQDWSIRMSGFLLEEPNQPNGAVSIQQQQERLLEFEGLSDSIEVQSELFASRQVFRLTVIGISFNQMPGKPYLVPFTLSCESDDPIELLLQ